jgi:hypothetical protein
MTDTTILELRIQLAADAGDWTKVRKLAAILRSLRDGSR